MKPAITAAAGILLGALLWSGGASADCRYQQKTIKEGAAICRTSGQFECGPNSVWKKLPTSCPSKPDGEQTQESVDKMTGKDSDTGAQKPQNPTS